MIDALGIIVPTKQPIIDRESKFYCSIKDLECFGGVVVANNRLVSVNPHLDVESSTWPIQKSSEVFPKTK